MCASNPRIFLRKSWAMRCADSRSYQPIFTHPLVDALHSKMSLPPGKQSNLHVLKGSWSPRATLGHPSCVQVNQVELQQKLLGVRCTVFLSHQHTHISSILSSAQPRAPAPGKQSNHHRLMGRWVTLGRPGPYAGASKPGTSPWRLLALRCTDLLPRQPTYTYPLP